MPSCPSWEVFLFFPASIITVYVCFPEHTNNLSEFISMEPGTGVGQVLTCDQFIERFSFGRCQDREEKLEPVDQGLSSEHTKNSCQTKPDKGSSQQDERGWHNSLTGYLCSILRYKCHPIGVIVASQWRLVLKTLYIPYYMYFVFHPGKSIWCFQENFKRSWKSCEKLFLLVVITFVFSFPRQMLWYSFPQKSLGSYNMCKKSHSSCLAVGQNITKLWCIDHYAFEKKFQNC